MLTFSNQLKEALNGSGEKQWQIASVHFHSNCVLLASLDYATASEAAADCNNKQWNTWIDYEKFFELMRKKKTEDGENNRSDDLRVSLA